MSYSCRALGWNILFYKWLLKMMGIVVFVAAYCSSEYQKQVRLCTTNDHMEKCIALICKFHL